MNIFGMNLKRAYGKGQLTKLKLMEEKDLVEDKK